MSKEPNNNPKCIDFYFADLQLRVTIETDKDNTFFKLTDSHHKALQQIIYMGLSTFLYTLGLHSLDNHIKKVEDNEG